jgi:hypothetical protein
MRGGRAAIRTPCSRAIRRQTFQHRPQDYVAGRGCLHLSNNLPRKGETFSSVAIRWARLRSHPRPHCVHIRVIHGRKIVGHPRHGLRTLTTVDRIFRSGAASAHKSAHTRRTENPGQQSAQKKDRSWCSHSSCGNSVLHLLSSPYCTQIRSASEASRLRPRVMVGLGQAIGTRKLRSRPPPVVLQ